MGQWARVAEIGGDVAKRRWLKLKLPDTAEVQEVFCILGVWAKQRSTPRHLIRAIRLYHALLLGDVPRFWQHINEAFPGFALAQQFGQMAPMVRQMPVSKPVSMSTQNDLIPDVDDITDGVADMLGLGGLFGDADE